MILQLSYAFSKNLSREGLVGSLEKKYHPFWNLSFIAIAVMLNHTSCSASTMACECTCEENCESNTNSNLSFDESCDNFNFHVDFLYWKANEDGLEYGTKIIASPLIGESSNANMKLLDPHFNWDPGFCLGAAYNFSALDGWTLQANWTHIHNHAHGNSSAEGIESQVGDVNTIISPWVNLLFELRSGASHATAHWLLKYDTIDLDLEKSVCLNNRFLLTPFFGLRGAWIDQDYKAITAHSFSWKEAPPFLEKSLSKEKTISLLLV